MEKIDVATLIAEWRLEESRLLSWLTEKCHFSNSGWSDGQTELRDRNIEALERVRLTIRILSARRQRRGTF